MDHPASVENVSFVSHDLSNRSWCAAYLMQPIFSGWDRLPAKILLLLRFSVNQNARGAPIGHSQDGFGWRPGGPLLGRLSVDRMARLARPRRPRVPASGRRSDRGPALMDGVIMLYTGVGGRPRSSRGVKADHRGPGLGRAGPAAAAARSAPERVPLPRPGA